MPCRCPLKYHHSSGALCGASSCGSRTPAAPLPAAGPALTRSGTIVPADAAPEPGPSDITASTALASEHRARRRTSAFTMTTVVSVAYARYARQYAFQTPAADATQWSKIGQVAHRAVHGARHAALSIQACT